MTGSNSWTAVLCYDVISASTVAGADKLGRPRGEPDTVAPNCDISRDTYVFISSNTEFSGCCIGQQTHAYIGTLLPLGTLILPRSDAA